VNFDLAGPLPVGTTVIEASAGSGKTYAIVALATRYVAEGIVDPSQLMLVTFGRAATQELRERTRERFVRTADALADIDSARSSGDSLVAYLAATSDAEVTVRRRRLVRALSDFDAATIATTHSFCQRMLDELGIGGEREPAAMIVESVDDLLDDVVDDLYLRDFGGYTAPKPLMSLGDAREAARSAQGDRQARLAPFNADTDTEAGQRVAFALAARAEVERRKRHAGVRDFDDLLELLRDTLADPVHGESACRRIQQRYRVVLVDEFQDTDPVQWEILRRAFHGTTTLILVGDPKQAIYAFRGAEVLSYLDAVQLADEHRGLVTNWRTDRGLMTALEHLYGGAALGHPEIVVHPVQAAHRQSRLPGETPLRLRYLSRTGSGPLGGSGFPAVAALRARVADDLAADVVRLLDRRPQFAADGTSRPVEPGDIAVLVRKAAHIPFIHDALTLVGVPVVLAGGASVFATPSATDWLWLLQALEQPHRADRVRLAAMTALIGRTAVQLDTDGDGELTSVGGQLRELATVFTRSGFAAVFEQLARRNRLDDRMLRVEGGDRRVTDLRHLAQLLNRAAAEESFGIAALTRWLDDRVANPASATMRDRSRRLDSDGAAVQIVTVHGSKGLEFPIVYLPFGWDGAKIPKPEKLLLHGEGGERILDIGGPSDPGYAARKRVHDSEEAGEELRLLYVALTRAMSQVVIWWAPGAQTGGSPLQRLLMGRTSVEAAPATSARVPDDPIVTTRLQQWAEAVAGSISVEALGSGPMPPTRWWPAGDVAGKLAAAHFDRSLDPLWRRTSYSALTASAHARPGVASEVEQPDRSDEPAEDPANSIPAGGVESAGRSVDSAGGGAGSGGIGANGQTLLSAMNSMPGGAAFGTLVHEVLERVDPSVPDLAAEVLRHCREAIGQRRAGIEPLALAEALLPVLHTPLGFGTLAGISPRDRLAELDFELPLAGGDTPVAAPVTLHQVARLLRRHLADGDILAGYADQLIEVDGGALRGYLVGSIDVVLRVAGPAYVVVDYKTNRLGPGELTALHYSRPLMAAEMIRSHYPLQALLYSVALHRYLRWRQPAYDPGRHLGGVQYHFVRGMVGPQTPPGCGVFDWKPPSALVTDLSDLLAGR
jgi:exodeoxyribonuclease V beta subunit